MSRQPDITRPAPTVEEVEQACQEIEAQIEKARAVVCEYRVLLGWPAPAARDRRETPRPPS